MHRAREDLMDRGPGMQAMVQEGLIHTHAQEHVMLVRTQAMVVQELESTFHRAMEQMVDLFQTT